MKSPSLVNLGMYLRQSPVGIVARGLGIIRGAYLATRILSILVKGTFILEVGMEREERDTAGVSGSQESIQGGFILVESPRIGSTQAAVLEDFSTLKFYDPIINS